MITAGNILRRKISRKLLINNEISCEKEIRNKDNLKIFHPWSDLVHKKVSPGPIQFTRLVETVVDSRAI